MNSLKTQISDLLSFNKLEEALELAKECALEACIAFDTPITVLMAQLSHLKKTYLSGALSFAEESKERQRLIARLLLLTEDMQKQLDAGIHNAPQNAPDKNVILFLGANPFDNLALALERELEVISDGLLRFGKREAYDFRAKLHVTPADLQRMLLEAQSLKPRFVHFAGNAVVNHPDYGTGVIFEKEDGQAHVIDGKVLAAIFRQFPSVECVFLNTCDSGPSALEIGKEVKYAIGMNGRVFDDAAIEFAVAFYEAIASGNDVPFSFDFAKMRLQIGSFPQQASLPVLVADGTHTEPVYVPGDSHLDCNNPRILR